MALDPEQLKLNFLDNEISIQHKIGYKTSHPVKYLVIDKDADTEYKIGGSGVIPLLNIALNMAVSGASFQEFLDKYNDFSPIILSYIYFYYKDKILKNDIINYVNNQYNLNLNVNDFDVQPSDFLDILTQSLLNNGINVTPQLKQQITDMYREQDLFTTIADTITGMDFSRPSNIDGLFNNFGEWYSNDFLLSLENDVKYLNEILNIQNELLKYYSMPLYYTRIDVNRFTLVMEYNDMNTDPIEVFKNSTVSYQVPYLRYVQNMNNGDVFTKVYTGKSSTNKPNINDIVWLPGPGKIKDNYIYFTVWLGGEDENITKASKNSFLKGKFDIENRKLLIKISQTDTVQNVKDRINTAFNMQNTDESDMDTNGIFNLVAQNGIINYDNINYNLQFDQITLAYTIMNTKLFNLYLYLFEKDKVLAGKKRFKLHYRKVATDQDIAKNLNLSRASITPIQKQVFEAGKIFNYIDHTDLDVDGVPIEKQMVLPVGSNYLEVKLSRATSLDVMDEITAIFRVLMGLYIIEHRNKVINRYINILPTIGPSLTPNVQHEESTTFTRDQTRVDVTDMKSMWASRCWEKSGVCGRLLNDVDPDIFPPNYTRHFSPVPIIVKPEEKDIWESITIPGTNIKQQLLPYPKQDPKFYFGCPSVDENGAILRGKEFAPYPGVKKNTGLIEELKDQKDKYPYLPKCFTTNQLEPGNYSKKILEYYYGIKAEDQQKSKKPLDDKKGLPVDRVGFLPLLLEDVLENYTTGKLDGEFIRYGVVDDNNSFIHCVLTATNANPAYMGMNDNKKREYAGVIRKWLSNNTTPGLYKQELYTSTYQEIELLLNDNDIFFDPALFYRGIEEKFNINIFTFNQNPKTGEVYLEIPNNRYTHIRQIDVTKNCIIIYKYSGNQSNVLSTPKCELIGFLSGSEQYTFIFNEQITKYLYKLLNEISKTYTWNVVNVSDINIKELNKNPNIVYDRQIITREDMYQKLKLGNNIDKTQIRAQLIDNIGKQRGIVLNNNIMIIGLPSQPINVSTVDKIIEANITEVINFFTGDVIQGFSIVDNKVDGIWYPLNDVKYAIFVPIINITVDEVKRITQIDVNENIGPSNPYFNSGVNYNIILSNYRYQRNIILNYLYWLHTISQPVQLKPDDILSKPTQDTTYKYYLDNVSRFLPNIDNVPDAIRYIQTQAPSLIYNNKIYCYSNKLYDSLSYFITKLYKNSEGLKLEVPTQISDYYYYSSEGFPTSPNSLVFTNYHDYINWETEQSDRNITHNNIHTKLNLDLALNIEPYLYLQVIKGNEEEQSIDILNRFYIIQNVVKGTLKRAITVAYNWYLHRNNIGFFAPEYDGIYPDFIIYGITHQNKFAPYIIRADIKEPHLQILYYGTTYAAILPLL